MTPDFVPSADSTTHDLAKEKLPSTGNEFQEKAPEDLDGLSNGELHGTIKKLLEEGAKIWVFGPSIANAGIRQHGIWRSEEEREKFSQLSCALKAMSRRYPGIIREASPESLRAVMIEAVRISSRGLQRLIAPILLLAIKRGSLEEIRKAYPKWEDIHFRASGAHNELEKGLIAQKILDRELA